MGFKVYLGLESQSSRALIKINLCLAVFSERGGCSKKMINKNKINSYCCLRYGMFLEVKLGPSRTNIIKKNFDPFFRLG